MQASASPARQSASHSGPGKAAAVQPAEPALLASQQSSPDVVDLCTSPAPERPFAAAAAAAGNAEGIDELDLTDITQSPIQQSIAAWECKPAAKSPKKPLLGLAMSVPVTGSADPYWQRLSDLIVQGGVSAEHADELRHVFAEEKSDSWSERVPAYLLSGSCTFAV